MTVLYIVRHVQAEGNLKRIFHGHTDGDITELGKLQAERLAARFADAQISEILSSDLTRARKTAEAIASRHPGVPLSFSPEVREISAGVWEGKNFEGLGDMYPEEYAGFQAGDPSVRVGGGETIGEVAARMRKAADALAARNSGGVALLVSHGCAIRSLLSDYAGRPVAWGTNASVSKVVYGESGPVIQYMWDDSHLEGARSVKLP